MMRISVPLSDSEREVLARMATEALRDPTDQIRWILREEAERRGWWPPAIISESLHSPHEVTA